MVYFFSAYENTKKPNLTRKGRKENLNNGGFSQKQPIKSMCIFIILNFTLKICAVDAK